MAIDKETLLAGLKAEQRTVTIPGLGDVVVRGLTRAEVRHAQGDAIDPNDLDPLAFERRALALGLVEPQITEEEAGRLQETAGAGGLDVVMDAIAELSGIDPDRARREYLRFRGRS